MRLSPFWFISAFSTSLILSLLGFMALAGVLPAIIADWRLSNTEAGWLGGILFAGYVLGVPVLTSLTDRMDPKPIYLASAALAALAHFGFAFLADGFWGGLVLRFFAGVGLAGTYLPGLKALTDHLQGKAQQRGVTYYTATFAVGSGASLLVAGEVGASLDWHWAFAIAGSGAVGALLIVAAVLPRRGPAAERRQGAGRDFAAVLSNPVIVAYILVMFGTAFEVFASRIWLVAYFTEMDIHAPGATLGFSPSALAALVTLLGVPTGMIFGELALRTDRRRLLIALSCISLSVSLVIGFSGGPLPYLAVLLCLTSGCTAFGRTAPTVGGIVAHTPAELRGMAMAIYGTFGWLGGIVGPLGVGIALDLGGGTTLPGGWVWAFGVIALGPGVAALALWLLAGRRAYFKGP